MYKLVPFFQFYLFHVEMLKQELSEPDRHSVTTPAAPAKWHGSLRHPQYTAVYTVQELFSKIVKPSTASKVFTAFMALLAVLLYSYTSATPISNPESTSLDRDKCCIKTMSCYFL
jgi:hypothetical protein